MSIATVSVLRRILDDARRREAWASPPVVARLGAEALTSGARLWLFETQAVGRAPYASPLHFWAHGLAAFLDPSGQGHWFDAVAGQGLCDAVADRSAELALSLLSPECVWGGPYYRSYRMIDQPVFQSYVAESGQRYRAFFWEAAGWADSEFCGLDAGS